MIARGPARVTRQLVVMLREARPGRVKTRLGREIGMTEAARWFRHQCRALVRRMDDPRWRLVLAVTPDRDLGSRGLPSGLARVAQGGGDLGERMLRLFRTLPPGPVVIVGADIPGITPAHVARAFAWLGSTEAVIGPARDGGFWLIGLRRTRRLPRGLLDGVRWSTRYARTDTMIALRDRRIAFADTLSDIDTAADLRAFRRYNRMVK